MHIATLVDNGMCSSLRLTHLGGLDTTNDQTDELSYTQFIKYLHFMMEKSGWKFKDSGIFYEDFGFMVAYTVKDFQQAAEDNLAQLGFYSSPHTTQGKNEHYDEDTEDYIYGDVAIHYMAMNDLVPRLKSEYKRLVSEGKINA